jgi:ubiquinone/menaquinone biosynthesis C-methylase UbiE
MKQTDRSPDEMLREEFNRWAAEGKGEEMERHHFDITQKTLARMELRFGERVLDLGCGAGWASRILARMVGGEAGGSGHVVGLDISDEMVRRARAASDEFPNLTFVHGSAESIPWEENFFDKVLSVESFYYYADQDRVLGELYRVLAPRGRLFILINLYKDNPYSLYWVDELKVPVHARSSDEYVEMLRAHAFEEVEAHRIPDDTPSPAEYSGRWFRDVHELNDFKRIGALLLVARKPAVRPPAGE